MTNSSKFVPAASLADAIRRARYELATYPSIKLASARSEAFMEMARIFKAYNLGSMLCGVSVAHYVYMARAYNRLARAA